MARFETDYITPGKWTPQDHPLEDLFTSASIFASRFSTHFLRKNETDSGFGYVFFLQYKIPDAK